MSDCARATYDSTQNTSIQTNVFNFTRCDPVSSGRSKRGGAKQIFNEKVIHHPQIVTIIPQKGPCQYGTRPPPSQGRLLDPLLPVRNNPLGTRGRSHTRAKVIQQRETPYTLHENDHGRSRLLPRAPAKHERHPPRRPRHAPSGRLTFLISARAPKAPISGIHLQRWREKFLLFFFLSIFGGA